MHGSIRNKLYANRGRIIVEHEYDTGYYVIYSCTKNSPLKFEDCFSNRNEAVKVATELAIRYHYAFDKRTDVLD